MILTAIPDRSLPMLVVVEVAPRGRVVCLLLLCLVGLGIVGMHSVVSVSGERPANATRVVGDTDAAGHAAADVAGAATTDTTSTPVAFADTSAAGDSTHAALHLCLAVLTAAAFVLLVRFLRTTVPVASLAALRRHHRRIRPVPASVPPSSGRDVLTGVCVLRV